MLGIAGAIVLRYAEYSPVHLSDIAMHMANSIAHRGHLRATRSARRRSHGQWGRVHRQICAGLITLMRDRAAVDRAGQAGPEPVLGPVQRAVPR
jgi:hypothetical protein